MSQAIQIDLTFPHAWQAEALAARPLILPRRRFVYPRDAEEVERGALEVLVRPGQENFQPSQEDTQRNESGAPGLASETGESTVGRRNTHSGEPFLATCALGFRDPSAPTGIWSTPKPEELCAVAGGYAYLIDTNAPERFTMIRYRPVLRVLPIAAHGLLLFVGHHSILARGRDGEAWESEKLSDEGVEIAGLDDTGIHDGGPDGSAVAGAMLRGAGWAIQTDKETPFALDLKTGRRVA